MVETQKVPAPAALFYPAAMKAKMQSVIGLLVSVALVLCSCSVNKVEQEELPIVTWFDDGTSIALRDYGDLCRVIECAAFHFADRYEPELLLPRVSSTREPGVSELATIRMQNLEIAVFRGSRYLFLRADVWFVGLAEDSSLSAPAACRGGRLGSWGGELKADSAKWNFSVPLDSSAVIEVSCCIGGVAGEDARYETDVVGLPYSLEAGYRWYDGEGLDVLYERVDSASYCRDPDRDTH